jgi:tetratricopeptide (TPR) repeat protein/transcriptional regulator with XRE-family HTH domain
LVNAKREYPPNRKLLEARLKRHWSQRELAAHLGTTFVNVSRWERGITSPGVYYRQQLCQLFELSMSELGLEGQEEDGQSNDLAWFVPYPRNPLFTGREETLQRFYNLLHVQKGSTVPQILAICGLGGIGKTQTVLEYAYRFQREYQGVFWARGETSETLITDFVALAERLQIPDRDHQERKRVVEALKNWLVATPNWLLILDNVEDLTMITEFLPSRGSGHVVLTTRKQATGVLAQRVELFKMSQEEGALLLLRRAKLLETGAVLEEAADEDRISAQELSQLLDGLPLALDQAGAYVEETGCALADYLHYYQSSRATMLSLRGQGGIDHQQSVSATLSLSYEKIEQTHSGAANLLKLCAFLAPDAIPEELFSDAPFLPGFVNETPISASLELERAIAALRTYSFVRRNTATRTLTIHRLVQAVLRDRLNEQDQRNWAERAVALISRVLPEAWEQSAWPIYQRYLPHVEVCAAWIKQWQMTSRNAARLLDFTGGYLKERWQYAQAEAYLSQALAMYRQVMGEEQPEIAKALQRLGELYFHKGAYAQAKAVNQEALAIYRKGKLENDQIEAATCLNNQAMFLHALGDYAQAEPFYQEALSMREQLLGSEHPQVAESLNNLGFFYYAQGKYQQAEPLYQRALAIYEKTQSPESHYIARGLNNLAKLYVSSGEYARAEPLYLRAQEIYARAQGAEHPMVAFVLYNLGDLYHQQKRVEEAELLYLEALAIREKALPPDHPDLATVLNSLGLFYFEQERYAQALPLCERALAIREKMLGSDHPRTAQSLHGLAQVYARQGQYEQAEALYRRALDVREKALGATHPDVAATLESLADVLAARQQEAAAKALKDRAAQIRGSASHQEIPHR